MSAYPFLSPEWIDAVSAIRDEFRGDDPVIDIPIRANVTITDAPFDEPTITGHVDTTGVALSLEIGHLDESDFALEMTYDTAYTMFVDRDPQALLGILVGGDVKLTGDSSKILGLAGMAAPPADGDTTSVAREVVRRIDDVTLRTDD